MILIDITFYDKPFTPQEFSFNNKAEALRCVQNFVHKIRNFNLK